MNISVSAIDLFCGVGGLTHGLIQSGIPVVAGIDTDETCRYAFEKNNKSVFLNVDVRKLTSRTLDFLYPEDDIKILAGCAPCQPFSPHTNKIKNRKSDQRWSLLYSFFDLIEDVGPEIVTMENVVTLTNHHVFDDFVSSLKSLGYSIFWKRVYCPDYGIPQSRRRLILLASKLGKIELIPATHSKSQYKEVKDAIKDLDAIADGEVPDKDPMHKTYKLSEINKKRIQQSKPSGTWEDWDEDLLLACHKKESGKTYSAVYGRMRWDGLAPTITTQFYNIGTGRFGHPEQDRALSLREGAILQTFPKDYVFVKPDDPILFARMGTHIGNAVPVRLGKIIGLSILNHLEKYRDNDSRVSMGKTISYERLT